MSRTSSKVEPRSKKQRIVFLATLLALVLVVTLIPVGLFLQDSNPVVATYTGGQVHEDEFNKQFAFQRKFLMPTFAETPENKEAFLQEYIALHKLMVAAAKKEGVTIDESMIDSQLQEYKAQVLDLVYSGDQKAFTAKLNDYEITDDDIRELVRHDQYLRRYRELAVQHLSVTDDEAKAFYDQNPAQFMTGTVAHILVGTEAEAQKVRERLASEDFTKLAKEVSTDPTAQQNGGVMTGVQFDLFEPTFRDAAGQIALGQLSDPVQTSYGWHILRVDARTTTPFDQAKDSAKQQLLTDKQDKAWNDLYLQHLREGNVQVSL